MGSEEDEEGFDKSGLTGKLAFTGSSLFVVVLLVIILLHCYGKHLRRLQQRRRQRIASLYQLSTQSNNGGAVPLELINFEQPQPKNGLDPLVIALLPEFVYKPKAKNDHDHDHKDEGDEQVIDCSVCLSTIDEETTVRLLPNCKHVFHVECIDMWLGSNTTCPICRAVVEPRVQDLQAEGGSGQAVQATAPPMAMDDEGSRVQQGDEVEKASASGSRLSSFRRMFSSRDRSSRRVETCGQEDAAADDLERQ